MVLFRRVSEADQSMKLHPGNLPNDTSIVGEEVFLVFTPLPYQLVEVGESFSLAIVIDRVGQKVGRRYSLQISKTNSIHSAPFGLFGPSGK